MTTPPPSAPPPASRDNTPSAPPPSDEARLVEIRSHQTKHDSIYEQQDGFTAEADRRDLLRMLDAARAEIATLKHAATRANDCLAVLIRELSDPGVETLATKWELEHTLARLRSAAPDWDASEWWKFAERFAYRYCGLRAEQAKVSLRIALVHLLDHARQEAVVHAPPRLRAENDAANWLDRQLDAAGEAVAAWSLEKRVALKAQIAKPDAGGRGEDEEQLPCPVCGNEERGQGGYLSCECPAPSPSPEAAPASDDVAQWLLQGGNQYAIAAHETAKSLRAEARSLRSQAESCARRAEMLERKLHEDFRRQFAVIEADPT